MQSALEKTGRDMRILVVDDDRPSLMMTAFLLKEEGYTVFTADNGRDALADDRREDADLLILMMMPGMDGAGSDSPPAPQHHSLLIIILSAKARPAIVYGRDRADDYLAKPSSHRNCWPGCAWSCAARGSTFGERKSQLSVRGLSPTR